jgi:hypothetical protein
MSVFDQSDVNVELATYLLNNGADVDYYYFVSAYIILYLFN